MGENVRVYAWTMEGTLIVSRVQELFAEAVNFTSKIDFSISHTPDTVR